MQPEALVTFNKTLLWHGSQVYMNFVVVAYVKSVAQSMVASHDIRSKKILLLCLQSRCETQFVASYGLIHYYGSQYFDIDNIARSIVSERTNYRVSTK